MRTKEWDVQGCGLLGTLIQFEFWARLSFIQKSSIFRTAFVNFLKFSTVICKDILNEVRSVDPPPLLDMHHVWVHVCVCRVRSSFPFIFSFHLHYKAQSLSFVLVSGCRARVLMIVGLLIWWGLLFLTELRGSQFSRYLQKWKSSSVTEIPHEESWSN